MAMPTTLTSTLIITSIPIILLTLRVEMILPLSSPTTTVMEIVTQALDLPI